VVLSMSTGSLTRALSHSASSQLVSHTRVATTTEGTSIAPPLQPKATAGVFKENDAQLDRLASRFAFWCG